MSDLECKVCADPSVTSPRGVPATPGQAARQFTAWAEAQGIGRGELYGWATMADAFAAGRQAAIAAQEPKPVLVGPGRAAWLKSEIAAALRQLLE